MVKKIFSLLSYKDKKRIFFLFFLFIIQTLLETLSIGVVPIFIITITDYEKILLMLPQFLDLNFLTSIDEKKIILYSSVGVLLIFLLKNSFITFVNFFNLNLIKRIRSKIANDLFSYYLKNDYEFHITRNPSGLIRNIASEVDHTVSLIVSSIHFLKELLIATTIFLLLIFVDPLISMLIFITLGVFSSIFFLYTRKGSKFRGQKIQEYWGNQIKTINHGLGSIKENKILNKENFIIETFKNNISVIEKYNFIQGFLVTLPRLFLEVMAILIIVVVSVSFVFTERPFNEILPLLSLITVCAVRMIPSFNSISSTYLNIKHYTPALEIIYREIDNSKNFSKNKLSYLKNENKKETISSINFKNILNINNVKYTYPGTKIKILNKISFEIKKKEVVGIVGPSGVGKSTLIDVITGLLKPNEGEVTVDGINIHQNLKSWQKQIGYVPQEIYLLDDTIKANVAFGVKDKDYDQNAFYKALELSQIKDFIMSLPEKEMTKVGDRGIRLSGGQKQRIGIARAIYFSPTVLIFDEPTSALDLENEKKIISDLYKLSSNNSVIIISHKLSILKNCDKIYELSKDRFVQKSFEEFRKNEF